MQAAGGSPAFGAGGGGSVGSYTEEVAADSPYLWAKMDETSGVTMTNDGSYSTTGTYEGGVTVNQASLINEGKSVLLDGTSGWGKFTTAAAGDLNSLEWATEIVLERSVLADNEYIWHTGDSSTAASAGYMIHTAGTTELQLQGYASGAWRAARSVGLGLEVATPAMVAIKFNSVSQTVRFYKNGAFLNEVAWTWGGSTRNVADLFKLGIREHSDAVFAGSYFNGKMDCFAYWNSDSVTDERLLAHAQAAGLTEEGAYVSAVLASSPIALWRMNESSGSVYDRIGGLAGASTGSNIYSQPSLDSSDAANLSIRSNASRFTVPTDADLEIGAGGKTVEFIFQNASAASYGTRAAILGKKVQSGNFEGWAVRVSQTGSDGKPHFIIRQTGLSELSVKGSTALIDDTAYHIAVTYDGSTNASGVTIYVNGVAETNDVQTDTLSAHPTSSQGFELFAEGGGALPFAGFLDEVALYSTELSGATILAHAVAAGYA